MKLRHYFILIITAACFVNLVIGCRTFNQETKVSGNSELVDNLDVLLNMYRLIRNNYVDGEQLSTAELIERAAMGMASGLDPYTVYMPSEDAKSFEESATGEFCGIGVVLRKDSNKPYPWAESVIEGTPAHNAGIMAGDEFMMVDGENTDMLSLEEAVLRMRGELGTALTVKVHHSATGEEEELTLYRAMIPMNSIVSVDIVPNSTVGYMRIIQFALHTAEEYEKALRSLIEKNATGLIVDLRGNPGGSLQIVTQMCDIMLPPGTPIVSVEGRNPEKNSSMSAGNGFKFPMNIPMVILIDRWSASAAEIMAGCLKDNGRAVLVGEKSFGKGSVQEVYPFENGAALKLTIAKYFTPSHRPIHGVGIMPDVASPMTPAQMKKLWSIEDNSERLKADDNVQTALKVISGEIKIQPE